MYKPLLAELQAQEEKRVKFVKSSLDRFAKYFDHMGHKIVQKSAEMNSAVAVVNSEQDVRMFVDQHMSRPEYVHTVEFAVYERQLIEEERREERRRAREHNEEREKELFPRVITLSSEEEEDSGTLPPGEAHSEDGREEEMDFVVETLVAVVEDEKPFRDEAVRSRIKAAMRSRKCQLAVANFLADYTGPRLLRNQTSLSGLADIVHWLLDECDRDLRGSA